MVSPDHQAIAVLVAIRAGKLELAVPRVVHLLALLPIWRRVAVDLDVHRHAARLKPDQSDHRLHLGTRPFPRLGSHGTRPVSVDEVLHHDQLAVHDLRHLGMEPCKRRHILVAGRTGLAFSPIHAVEQVHALIDKDHGRVLKVVDLQGLRFVRPEPPAGVDRVDVLHMRRRGGFGHHLQLVIDDEVVLVRIRERRSGQQSRNGEATGRQNRPHAFPP